MTLRILHLEDNPTDAKLIHTMLKRSGLVIEVDLVENEKDFRNAIQQKTFDVILSDFKLPDFDGLAALKIAKELAPDTPVIFVSGTVGEETAVEALHSGATDYLLKDRLSRLAPAVERAIQDANENAERRRLEDQLRQSQKMEAIGQLAGGIAHDFNNLLTVINGRSQLLLEKFQASDPLRREVELIYETGGRAATLTRQLLTFSRKSVMQVVVLNLNKVIRDIHSMLQRLIGENIKINMALAKDLFLTQADAGQIEQVILNLAVNARDAMPVGGMLTLETANVVLDEAYSRTHFGVKPGKYVMLAVCDTGAGMDEAVQAHIFEPFFTTKGADKGTGLGLSTVYGIVKQSGGSIEVYSELNHGTTFKIYLPIADLNPSTAQAAETSAQPKSTGNEPILLVEDEEIVRELLTEILQLHGYKVLIACTGKEALSLCESHPGQIHVMISDVVMPQMSGPQLAERLKEKHPEIKVLFMSGYTDSAIVDHGVIEKGQAFIQKPFTNSSLTQKVREILDPKPRPPTSP